MQTQPLSGYFSWSFARTVISAFVILLLFVGGSWLFRNKLLDSWQTYTSIAATILGVGGVFVLVALASDAAQQAANVVGLGAVGLGSVMLAYKEVAAGFGKKEVVTEGYNQPEVGDVLFLQSTALIFITFVLMLWIVEFISSRPDDSALSKELGLAIGGIPLSSAVLAVGLSSGSGALAVIGWVVLLASCLAILFASKKRRQNRRTQT